MAGMIRRRPAGQTSGEDIVVEAAWLYYHDGLNQTEVAEKLGVSRATVVNYLQEAREKGFIRTTLSHDVFLGHRHGIELQSRFALEAAYILPDADDGDGEAFSRVARGAANWLPTLLAPGDVIGVAWGQTVYAMADAVERSRMPDLTIVQLVGSMATPYGFTAELCSALLARRLGANCINLHAPAILSDPELAARLRAEPILSAQLEALGRCNKVVFAAGSCREDSHIVSSGVASLGDLAAYRRAGARGVLCGRFVDSGGRPVRGPLDERMIGIELERMNGYEMAMLVSVGEEKVEPMLSVLRGGYVTHLVTDVATASAILQLDDDSGGQP
ncbi:sugar-binding transcriptional regulator [Nitratireductor sp. GCM10026969]|uniref:sugar-binding transcriptional regulator n=1 Tax=Nitratireductor sp. GCM10026969 TaxID=3252645 RepID=UPI00360D2A34